MSHLKTYLRTALAIVLGERCVVCDRMLPGAGICPHCLMELPYANLKAKAGNPMERILWTATPIQRASATLLYHPGYAMGNLTHAIKYAGRPDLAVELGRMAAREHLTTGLFEDIDALVPVPLHPNRQRERGYNQSEKMAEGVAEITGIPVRNYLIRTRDNRSQRGLSHEERTRNVAGIFATDARELQEHPPRHILLIDDVMTTGATCISCIQALTGSVLAQDALLPDLKVSVLTLAFSGAMHHGRLFPEYNLHPDYTVSNEDFRDKQHRPLA